MKIKLPSLVLAFTVAFTSAASAYVSIESIGTDLKNDTVTVKGTTDANDENLIVTVNSNGVSDSEFAPDDTVTRAMFVTILFRMENEPVVNFALVFADVLPEQWYTEAVRWAASEKIVSGTDENTFGTDDPITREQMAAIIYRYAKYKNIDTTEAENTNILSYEDYSDISEYAIPALQYAAGAGIMTGKTDKTINPSDTSTRAEAAAVIMRILNK